MADSTCTLEAPIKPVESIDLPSEVIDFTNPPEEDMSRYLLACASAKDNISISHRATHWSVDIEQDNSGNPSYYCVIQSPDAYFEFELDELSIVDKIIDAGEHGIAYKSEQTLGYVGPFYVRAEPDYEYDNEFSISAGQYDAAGNYYIVAGVNGDALLLKCFRDVSQQLKEKAND